MALAADVWTKRTRTYGELARSLVPCLQQEPSFRQLPFVRRCAGGADDGSVNARSKVELDPARSDFRRRHSMVLLSVVGGLFLVGFGISRVKAKRSEKPDIPTLFGTK